MRLAGIINSMKPTNYIIFVIFTAFFAGAATESFAQWSADTKISVSDTNAVLSENADICLAASGDSVHAVWWDTKNDSTAIFYRHSYDGGITWASPKRITSPSKSVDLPSIAISGSMVHVSYRNNADSGSYYIRSSDGGNTWGNPVSLGTYYFWPSIAASGSNVFIGFNSSISGNSEVYFRRSTDNGSTWSQTFQISNALKRSEDQSLSASGSYIHFVWNDNRTGIMQTWYRRSSDNGITWGPETQLTNAALFAYFPMVNAQGANIDVVRGDRDAANNFHIMYTHSIDFGSTWSTEQELSNNATSSAYPVVKRDGQNVHALWYDFNDDMYYRRSTDGGVTWEAAQSLVSAANKPAKPFIAISGPTLHVIWIDKREGHPEVYYKRYVSVDTTTQASVSPANGLVNLLEITPNPVSNYATLKLSVLSHLEDVKINFYDAAGRLSQTQLVGGLNEGLQSIPLILPQISGIAFLRIIAKGMVIGTSDMIIVR